MIECMWFGGLSLRLCALGLCCAGEPPKDGEKPPRPKKMTRRERFGTYDKTFEDELDMVPQEEGITHLYNTRGIVDKWLGHPTLDSIFPGLFSPTTASSVVKFMLEIHGSLPRSSSHITFQFRDV